MGLPFAVVELVTPVQFGRDAEAVTRLELKPSGRALRELVVPMSVDSGAQLVMVKPYELTLIGLRMAGIAGDKAFADLMDPRDIWEVAQQVMGFILAGPKGGKEPSPQ